MSKSKASCGLCGEPVNRNEERVGYARHDSINQALQAKVGPVVAVKLELRHLNCDNERG